MESKKCIGQYYTFDRMDVHIKCDMLMTNTPYPQCKKCINLIYKNQETITKYENLMKYLKVNNMIYKQY